MCFDSLTSYWHNVYFANTSNSYLNIKFRIFMSTTNKIISAWRMQTPRPLRSEFKLCHACIRNNIIFCHFNDMQNERFILWYLHYLFKFALATTKCHHRNINFTLVAQLIYSCATERLTRFLPSIYYQIVFFVN